MTVCSRILAGALTALGLLALAACSGGASSLKPVALLDDGAFAGSASLEDTRAGFMLAVSPDSFLGGEPAGDFTVDTARDGDALAVSIDVEDAVDLKALYCELSYDAARYTPLSVEHLPMYAGGRADAHDDDMLTISVLDRPGTVHIGQVLAHWEERAGLSGAGVLARVRFAEQPFTADAPTAAAAPRGVSSALASSAVGPKLELSLTHRRLKWDYYYPGDYNQDGLIGVSDLTPLGAHLDERGDSLGRWYDEELEKYVPLGYAFPPASLLHVIDGSADGLITVSDITQIGQHFDEGVAAFTLYESADPEADMPTANGAPSTLAPLATIPFSGVQGAAGQERVWFNLPLVAARDGFSYWLRPLKDEAEGTPSNPVRNDAGLAETFWLDVQPDIYADGGSLDEARLEFTHTPQALVVDIWLEGAENLSCFSSELHYDHTRCAFSSAYISRVPSNLPLTTGSSEFCSSQSSGQVLPAQLQMQDFVGSGYLARLSFAWEPEEQFTYFRLAHWDHYYQPRMMLAYDLQQQQVSWYYFNVGDYNQDGSVWYDDITQIGRHFNEVSGAFPDLFAPDQVEFMVDGNQDGTISVSDLSPTPVVHYGNSIDGYFVYMGAEPEVEPGPAPLGYVSLAEAEGDPFNERLRFSFHVDAPVPGQMLWVRPEFRGEVGEIPDGAVVAIP